MDGIQWQFRRMSPAEINQESMEQEFFQGEPINVRLVREVIQNSLDAALSKRPGLGAAGPVRVRFSLAGIHHPVPAERAERYFTGLEPHLKAIKAVTDLDDDINARLEQGHLTAGGVPYIVIEDDRAVGLNGDWQQSDDSPAHPAQGNDFYWFFRNVGRSGKGDADNGSWGLGKWVFPDASAINSYIVVTRRSADDETLLMGQSVLNKHTIDGQRYPPYGYFAEHNAAGFQLPLRMSNPEHRPFIRQCSDDFDRRFRHGPGLSVIIPFPRGKPSTAGAEPADADTLDKSRLLAAVIRNYFYPIIAEQLEVIIDDGDGPPAQLTGATLDGHLSDLELGDTGEHSAQSYRKLFAMFRRIRDLPEDAYIDLAHPPGNDTEYSQYADLVAQRPDYAAGKLLAFRIGLGAGVQRKGDSPKNTAFHLYVQKDDTLQEGHDYYVRGTLSIPDMDYIRQHKARALLVVKETEPLAAMLRDSEPPSHSAWRPQVDRVTKRWVAARRHIDSVRRAPANLLRLLETPREGLQKDALADIFSWDGKGRTAPSPARSPATQPNGDAERDGPDSIVPAPTPRNFAVSRAGSGFQVRCSPGTVPEGPIQGLLQVAYVTPRGDSFKAYREMDFRLHGANALPVTVAGGSYAPGSAGNELLLTIDDPARFSLAVQGFDPVRDVRLRVDWLTAATPDAPEPE